MRRFRFPLAGVLRLRGHVERAARRALGEALQRQQLAERRLQNVEQGLREFQEEAAGSGGAARLAQALAAGLGRLQWRAQAELRAAEAAVEQRRGDYLETRKNRQALQKLRERRHEEWRQAALAAEQAELDELARLGRAVRDDAEVRT